MTEDEHDDEGRDYVRHLVEERESLRPRKVNNSKKRKREENDPTYIPEPRVTSVACTRCGSKSVPVADEHTAEYICGDCGTVVAGDRVPSVGYSDSVVVHRAPVSACENYFKERMSQWRRWEPAIPHAAQTKLRETYRALRVDGGLVRLSDVLTKSEVRVIVIHAGLPPKKLVEKWLTIRRMLLERDDCPMPRESLVEALIGRFRVFLRTWNEHPDMHYGRKSLPNINFLICNFLLLESAEDYDVHAKWFPQVTDSKRKILWHIWVQYCLLLEWPIYIAEYDADGKLHRVEQKVLGKRKRT